MHNYLDDNIIKELRQMSDEADLYWEKLKEIATEWLNTNIKNEKEFQKLDKDLDNIGINSHLKDAIRTVATEYIDNEIWKY